jgi:dolichyl-phosphate-mannose--protein O-mannosyl transferase
MITNEHCTAELSQGEAQNHVSAAATKTRKKPPFEFEPYLTPLGLLLGALVLLGLYLRMRSFGYPASLQFDEHHFVETARGYGKGQADWNDHPPLGKLLILLGMRAFGDNSTGFRIPALVAGVLAVVIGCAATERLFRSRSAAPFAAALLSADGFLIAYSRAALLDGFLTLAALSTLLLLTFDLSLAWGVVAGLVLGFATSIKFSGVTLLLPLLFGVWLSKQPARTKSSALIGMALAAAFVYFATYSLGLGMTGKPNTLGDVIADTGRLLKHHSDLTEMKNPATSGWSTWFLPVRPLLLGFEEKHGAIRALSSLGNLVSWWSAVLVSLASLGVLLRLGWVQVLQKQRDSSEPAAATSTHGVTEFVLDNGRSVLASLLTAIGFIAPWVLTHRDSYIYHFLPAYAALIVLLSGALGWYEQRQPTRVFWFAVVALLVAAFYAPLWSYTPVSREAFNLRLFLGSWR